MDDSAARGPTDFRDECDIAAFGMAQATLEECARLRKEPGPRRGRLADVSILRHADEHTVIGVAALLAALEHYPEAASFDDWGVVAAPRWPGRVGTAHALDKFHTEGPRYVSALLIPNLCLHSMSGTLSLAFQMRGPNFGAGGGLANIADGLFTGLVVQLEHRLPGTWVVFSEWNVEPLGAPESARPVASALAMALVPPGQGRGLRLRLQPSAVSPSANASHAGQPRLGQLTDFLNGEASLQNWVCPLDWGMEMTVSRREASSSWLPNRRAA